MSSEVFWYNTDELDKRWDDSKEANTAHEQKKSDIEKTRNISSVAIEWLDFWYQSIQQKSMISENDSIDWLLEQNEQVQLLLSEILSDYKNYIWTDKENLKLLIRQEKTLLEKDGIQEHWEQSNMIQSMYEYMLNNDDQLWFEIFIKLNETLILPSTVCIITTLFLGVSKYQYFANRTPKAWG